MEQSLYQKLYHYHEEDIYPFHMPGHKRNPVFKAGFFPVEEDITEITGFDDLHHAEDLIKSAEEYAAALFGSREVFFSINGSTAAILAAVSAAVKKGGKIVAARNCHKSFYHALYLREIDPVCVFPEVLDESGICGSICPAAVEKALEENPDAEAVFLTSPTYDGVVSDIRSIAETAHRHSVPLIVDEAHGAHFIFSDYFPESSIQCGADLVIHSIHKTLPSLTQTALLHLCSERVSRSRIARYMSIYQTSSPSYPLMAGMDYCFHFLAEEKEKWFGMYTARLNSLRNSLKSNQHVRLLFPDGAGRSVYDYDRSKILLSAEGMNGKELLRIFHEDYRLEMEMAASTYVVALTSVCDTEEGFGRLDAAVRDMDSREFSSSFASSPDFILHPKKRMGLSEAMDADAETVLLEESVGRISAEFMYLYPPGIPLIVPGEQISLQFVQNMRRYIQEGMDIAGLKDMSGRHIDCIHR